MKLSERIIHDVGQMRADGPTLNLACKPVLQANLLFMYQVMKASERLLEEAIKECKSGALRDYYVDHLEEERKHEEWLAEDLKWFGIDVTAISTIPLAAALAGAQYYNIKHVSPACLLGYMAVLEGFPFEIEVLKQLEAIYGKAPFRCLRYHAVHDQEHRVDLFRVIDAVGDHRIYETAIQTQHSLNDFANRVNAVCR